MWSDWRLRRWRVSERIAQRAQAQVDQRLRELLTDYVNGRASTRTPAQRAYDPIPALMPRRAMIRSHPKAIAAGTTAGLRSSAQASTASLWPWPESPRSTAPPLDAGTYGRVHGNRSTPNIDPFLSRTPFYRSARDHARGQHPSIPGRTTRLQRCPDPTRSTEDAGTGAKAAPRQLSGLRY